MTQVSYGTITITDTNDIESIVVEYARNQSTSTPPGPETGGWSTTRPAWAQGYYIWQRTRIHKSGTQASADTFGAAVCLTGSTGQTGGTGAAGRSLTGTTTQYTTAASNVTITQNNMGSYTWFNNVPAYSSSTPAYWVRVTNTYSNPSSTEYIIYKDQGLTDAVKTSYDANTTAQAASDKADDAWDKADNAEDIAQQASNDVGALTTTYNTFINTKAKYFVHNSSGSIVIASREGESSPVAFDENTVSTYGYNTLNAPSYIALRYNSTELAKLSTGALIFYKPNTTNKGMELTSTALTFYNPTTHNSAVQLSGQALNFYSPSDDRLALSLDSSGLNFYGSSTVNPDASLTLNGLMLKKGGIKAGTDRDNGFVYLSSEDYQLKDATHNGLTINGHTPTAAGTDGKTVSDPAWREIVGTKFGVDSDGNLYASGANIQGKITVTSGSNVYTKDEVDDAVVDATAELISAKEASGSIVHIEDASEYPALDCKVDLEPIQDLHGYDKPWSGGAGKNLMQCTATSKTESGVTWTVNSDGSITVSGTATGYTSLTYGLAYVYGISGNVTLSGVRGAKNVAWAAIYLKDENKTKIGSILFGEAITEPITWNMSDYPNAYYVEAVVKRNNNIATNGTFGIQLEKGSTFTAWQPYENICPISGHTEVVTEACGKNLFDKTAVEVGYVSDKTGEVNPSTSYRCTDYIAVEPNATYYVKTEQNNGGWGAWYDANKNYISGAVHYFNTTLTAPSNARYMRLTCLTSTSGNIDTFAINYPSTDTSYHAYNGQTYTTALGRTVYGGTLDVVSGELVVDRASVDLGTLNYTLSTEAYPRFNTNSLPNIKAPKTVNDLLNGICEAFDIKTATETYRGVIGLSANENGALRIYAPTYSDVTAFKTAMNGVQLCYELATPQTYQLTAQQIDLLMGTNNVWSENGSVYLKYVTMNSDMLSLMDKSNDDLDRAKAEIKVTTDGISSEVSQKVGNSEIISKINQSAEAIKIQASKIEIDGTATFNAIKSNVENTVNTAVNDIEIGGRNLLIGTPNFHLTNGSVLDTKTNFLLYVWTTPGKTYSGYKSIMPAKVYSSPGHITETFVAQNDSLSYFCIKHNGTKHDYNVFFDAPTEAVKAGETYTLSFDIVGANPSVENGLDVKNFKLERGNRATDWTPAPEDLAATATNYITKIDERGITIHPEDPTSSNYLQINSDGISINTTKGTIAKYGESIRLGDSLTYLEITSNIVEFFDNKKLMAKFGYDEIFESYGVQGENIFIKGAGNALRLDNNVNGSYQGQYILETRANGHLSLKPGLSRTEEE